METPSSASLAMAKKTGALVFFIGCAVGLCISEILVGVASQRANQDAHKASLAYIAQVRNSSTTANATTKPIEKQRWMPDKHVAVLHTGGKDRITTAEIREGNRSELVLQPTRKHHKHHEHRKGHRRHEKVTDVHEFQVAEPGDVEYTAKPCKGTDDQNCKANSDVWRIKRHVVSHHKKKKHSGAVRKALADLQLVDQQPESATKHHRRRKSAPRSEKKEENHKDVVKKLHQLHDRVNAANGTKNDPIESKEKKPILVHVVTTTHQTPKSITKPTSKPKSKPVEKKARKRSRKPAPKFVLKPTPKVKATPIPKPIPPVTAMPAHVPKFKKIANDSHMDLSLREVHKKSNGFSKDSRACKRMMKDLDVYEKDEKLKSEELMTVSFRDGVDEVQNLLHTWVRTPVHVVEGLTFAAVTLCLLLYWVDDSIQSRLRRIGLNV